jgi:simple sugar transport system ATP-binding protein
MRGIVKRFDSVLANDHIDLDVRAGEIHALLGENGAGKTTLMNVLYGLVRPDEGTIAVAGRQVSIRSPQDATALGIGMVHQHFMLVPTITVAENVVLGERGGLRLSRSELERVERRIEELGTRYGLEVPARAFVWQLSVGERQRVEILRAMHRDARIVILDEPTTSLAPSEVDQLLGRLRAMAAGGAAVVLITHHLSEVMAFADRITVLRRGRRVATVRPEETSVAELARRMVGRDVKLAAFLQEVETGGETAELTAEVSGPGPSRPVLELRELRVPGSRGVEALRGVSLEVRPREIVAIAGVDGNGQGELEEALCGLQMPSGGTVELAGEDVTGRRTAELLRAGMGVIPSDRYRRGLILEMSVADNLVVDRIDRPPFGGRAWISPRAILAHATRLISRFRIKVPGAAMPVRTLSGGNSQRVVLARVFSAEPVLLLAAQPTRGLDVGGIEFVWGQLRSHRDGGVGILLISNDLDEVLALADRCFVLYRGRLVGEWPRTRFDREAIGLAMGGGIIRDGGEEGS